MKRAKHCLIYNCNIYYLFLLPQNLQKSNITFIDATTSFVSLYLPNILLLLFSSLMPYLVAKSCSLEAHWTKSVHFWTVQVHVLVHATTCTCSSTFIYKWVVWVNIYLMIGQGVTTILWTYTCACKIKIKCGWICSYVYIMYIMYMYMHALICL